MDQEIVLYHPYSFWYGSLYNYKSYIAYGCGGVMLIVIGAVCMYRFFNTPARRARRRLYLILKKIENLPLERYANCHNEFYVTISHLLRSYCAQRYGILAYSMTDTQLIEALRKKMIKSEVAALASLEVIGSDLTLVKFADHISESEYMKQLRDRVIFFIKQTISLDTSGMLKKTTKN